MQISKAKMQELANQILEENKSEVQALAKQIAQNVRDSIFESAIDSLLDNESTHESENKSDHVKQEQTEQTEQVKTQLTNIKFVDSNGADKYIDVEKSTTKNRKALNEAYCKLLQVENISQISIGKEIGGIFISPYKTKYGKKAVRGFVKNPDEAKKTLLNEGLTLV